MDDNKKEVKKIGADVKIFLDTEQSVIDKEKNISSIKYPKKYDVRNHKGKNWNVLDINLSSKIKSIEHYVNNLISYDITWTLDKISDDRLNGNNYSHKYQEINYENWHDSLEIFEIYSNMFENFNFLFKAYDENGNEISIDKIEREKYNYSYYSSKTYKIFFKFIFNEVIKEKVSLIKIFLNENFEKYGIPFYEWTPNSNFKLDTCLILNKYKCFPVIFYDENDKPIADVKYEYEFEYDFLDYNLCYINSNNKLNIFFKDISIILGLSNLKCKIILGIDDFINYSNIKYKNDKLCEVDPKTLNFYPYLNKEEFQTYKYDFKENGVKILSICNFDKSLIIDKKLKFDLNDTSIRTHILDINNNMWFIDSTPHPENQKTCFFIEDIENKITKSYIKNVKIIDGLLILQKHELFENEIDNNGHLEKNPNKLERIINIDQDVNEIYLNGVKYEKNIDFSFNWEVKLLKISFKTNLNISNGSGYIIFSRREIVYDKNSLNILSDKTTHPAISLLEDGKSIQNDFYYIYNQKNGKEVTFYFKKDLDFSKKYTLQITDNSKIYDFDVIETNYFDKDSSFNITISNYDGNIILNNLFMILKNDKNKLIEKYKFVHETGRGSYLWSKNGINLNDINFSNTKENVTYSTNIKHLYIKNKFVKLIDMGTYDCYNDREIKTTFNLNLLSPLVSFCGNIIDALGNKPHEIPEIINLVDSSKLDYDNEEGWYDDYYYGTGKNLFLTLKTNQLKFLNIILENVDERYKNDLIFGLEKSTNFNFDDRHSGDFDYLNSCSRQVSDEMKKNFYDFCFRESYKNDYYEGLLKINDSIYPGEYNIKFKINNKEIKNLGNYSLTKENEAKRNCYNVNLKWPLVNIIGKVVNTATNEIIHKSGMIIRFKNNVSGENHDFKYYSTDPDIEDFVNVYEYDNKWHIDPYQNSFYTNRFKFLFQGFRETPYCIYEEKNSNIKFKMYDNVYSNESLEEGIYTVSLLDQNEKLLKTYYTDFEVSQEKQKSLYDIELDFPLCNFSGTLYGVNGEIINNEDWHIELKNLKNIDQSIIFDYNSFKNNFEFKGLGRPFKKYNDDYNYYSDTDFYKADLNYDKSDIKNHKINYYETYYSRGLNENEEYEVIVKYKTNIINFTSCKDKNNKELLKNGKLIIIPTKENEKNGLLSNIKLNVESIATNLSGYIYDDTLNQNVYIESPINLKLNEENYDGDLSNDFSNEENLKTYSGNRSCFSFTNIPNLGYYAINLNTYTTIDSGRKNEKYEIRSENIPINDILDLNDKNKKSVFNKHGNLNKNKDLINVKNALLNKTYKNVEIHTPYWKAQTYRKYNYIDEYNEPVDIPINTNLTYTNHSYNDEKTIISLPFESYGYYYTFNSLIKTGNYNIKLSLDEDDKVIFSDETEIIGKTPLNEIEKNGTIISDLNSVTLNTNMLIWRDDIKKYQIIKERPNNQHQTTSSNYSTGFEKNISIKLNNEFKPYYKRYNNKTSRTKCIDKTYYYNDYRKDRYNSSYQTFSQPKNIFQCLNKNNIYKINIKYGGYDEKNTVKFKGLYEADLSKNFDNDNYLELNKLSFSGFIKSYVVPKIIEECPDLSGNIDGINIPYLVNKLFIIEYGKKLFEKIYEKQKLNKNNFKNEIEILNTTLNNFNSRLPEKNAIDYLNGKNIDSFSLKTLYETYVIPEMIRTYKDIKYPNGTLKNISIFDLILNHFNSYLDNNEFNLTFDFKEENLQTFNKINDVLNTNLKSLNNGLPNVNAKYFIKNENINTFTLKHIYEDYVIPNIKNYEKYPNDSIDNILIVDIITNYIISLLEENELKKQYNCNKDSSKNNISEFEQNENVNMILDFKISDLIQSTNEKTIRSYVKFDDLKSYVKYNDDNSDSISILSIIKDIRYQRIINENEYNLLIEKILEKLKDKIISKIYKNYDVNDHYNKIFDIPANTINKELPSKKLNEYILNKDLIKDFTIIQLISNYIVPEIIKESKKENAINNEIDKLPLSAVIINSIVSLTTKEEYEKEHSFGTYNLNELSGIDYSLNVDLSTINENIPSIRLRDNIDLTYKKFKLRDLFENKIGVVNNIPIYNVISSYFKIKNHLIDFTYNFFNDVDFKTFNKINDILNTNLKDLNNELPKVNAKYFIKNEIIDKFSLKQIYEDYVIKNIKSLKITSYPNNRIDNILIVDIISNYIKLNVGKKLIKKRYDYYNYGGSSETKSDFESNEMVNMIFNLKISNLIKSTNEKTIRSYVRFNDLESYTKYNDNDNEDYYYYGISILCIIKDLRQQFIINEEEYDLIVIEISKILGNERLDEVFDEYYNHGYYYDELYEKTEMKETLDINAKDINEKLPNKNIRDFIIKPKELRNFTIRQLISDNIVPEIIKQDIEENKLKDTINGQPISSVIIDSIISLTTKEEYEKEYKFGNYNLNIFNNYDYIMNIKLSSINEELPSRCLKEYIYDNESNNSITKFNLCDLFKNEAIPKIIEDAGIIEYPNNSIKNMLVSKIFSIKLLKFIDKSIYDKIYLKTNPYDINEFNDISKFKLSFFDRSLPSSTISSYIENRTYVNFSIRSLIEKTIFEKQLNKNNEYKNISIIDIISNILYKKLGYANINNEYEFERNDDIFNNTNEMLLVNFKDINENFPDITLSSCIMNGKDKTISDLLKNHLSKDQTINLIEMGLKNPNDTPIHYWSMIVDEICPNIYGNIICGNWRKHDFSLFNISLKLKIYNDASVVEYECLNRGWFFFIPYIKSGWHTFEISILNKTIYNKRKFIYDSNDIDFCIDVLNFTNSPVFGNITLNGKTPINSIHTVIYNKDLKSLYYNNSLLIKNINYYFNNTIDRNYNNYYHGYSNYFNYYSFEYDNKEYRDYGIYHYLDSYENNDNNNRTFKNYRLYDLIPGNYNVKYFIIPEINDSYSKTSNKWSTEYSDSYFYTRIKDSSSTDNNVLKYNLNDIIKNKKSFNIKKSDILINDNLIYDKDNDLIPMRIKLTYNLKSVSYPFRKLYETEKDNSNRESWIYLNFKYEKTMVENEDAFKITIEYTDIPENIEYQLFDITYNNITIYYGELIKENDYTIENNTKSLPLIDISKMYSKSLTISYENIPDYIKAKGIAIKLFDSLNNEVILSHQYEFRKNNENIVIYGLKNDIYNIDLFVNENKLNHYENIVVDKTTNSYVIPYDTYSLNITLFDHALNDRKFSSKAKVSLYNEIIKKSELKYNENENGNYSFSSLIQGEYKIGVRLYNHKSGYVESYNPEYVENNISGINVFYKLNSNECIEPLSTYTLLDDSDINIIAPYQLFQIKSTGIDAKTNESYSTATPDMYLELTRLSDNEIYKISGDMIFNNGWYDDRFYVKSGKYSIKYLSINDLSSDSQKIIINYEPQYVDSNKTFVIYKNLATVISTSANPIKITIHEKNSSRESGVGFGETITDSCKNKTINIYDSNKNLFKKIPVRTNENGEVILDSLQTMRFRFEIEGLEELGISDEYELLNETNKNILLLIDKAKTNENGKNNKLTVIKNS